VYGRLIANIYVKVGGKEVDLNLCVRELEKQLRRNARALAETAALLVLQKSAGHLGDEDDDTGKKNDE
jgi:hypothetical protein